MQIEDSRIAIRERAWLDNLDLALHVIRADAGSVVVVASVGILPMIALNYALFNYESHEWSEETAFAEMWTSALSVMVEAPLATAPLTLYLGQALFVARPAPKTIVRDFFSCLPQLFLMQFLLRIVLILLVVTWFVPYVTWTYLSEVILLERNPLVAGRGKISTLKRNAQLHRGTGGDYILRGAVAGALALMLGLALWTTQDVVAGQLLGIELTAPAQSLALQTALWIVAVFFTVARYLAYLDQRIRNEGWEVDVTFRAQRRRLIYQEGPLSTGTTTRRPGVASTPAKLKPDAFA